MIDIRGLGYDYHKTEGRGAIELDTIGRAGTVLH